MNNYLILSNDDECFEIGLLSSILIDVGSLNVSDVLIGKLIEVKPSVICFFGANSEAWHDAFDGALNDDHGVLTTWHCNEPVDEVLWEFFNVHVLHAPSVGGVWVIGIGASKFVDLAKEYCFKKSGI